MLKKLMSLAVIGMLMTGCADTKESIKPDIRDTSNTKQEQQVETKKRQEQRKEELTKKGTTKKEQNDNIDPETGLAKVKEGRHLAEEAEKQDRQRTYDEDDYANSNLKDVKQYQCSNCDEYYREGAVHTCTREYTDNERNTIVESWKNGKLVDTTVIYKDYEEPDEFKDTEK